MYRARARGEYISRTDTRTRSSALDVQPSRHRISTTQHAVSYVAPKFWNTLPEDLRSIDNYKRFKKSLKEHLLDKYSES